MFSDQININGLTLHYYHNGQGSPALLLHGYGHAYTMWERPIQCYLQDKYHCYAIDLPGHGASDKPSLEWYTLENFTETIRQFCRTLQLEKILLIGYSMGGLIALNFTLKYPELVSKLVTINAPIKGDFLAVWDALLYLERLTKLPFVDYLLKIYTKVRPLALPVEARRYARLGMLFSPSCRRVQRELGQCTIQSLFGSYKMIRQADLSQRVADLRLPMLVIVSNQDKVVPLEQGQALCEQAAQARLAVIARCGHLPIDEQPALFDAALKDYLDIGQNHHLNTPHTPVIL